MSIESGNKEKPQEIQQQKEKLEQQKREQQEKQKQEIVKNPSELTKLTEQIADSRIKSSPLSTEEQKKDSGDLQEAKKTLMNDIKTISANPEMSPEKKQKEIENAWNEFATRIDTIQGRQEAQDSERATQQTKNMELAQNKGNEASKTFFETAMSQLEANRQQTIASSKKMLAERGNQEHANARASVEKDLDTNLRLAFGSEASSAKAA